MTENNLELFRTAIKEYLPSGEIANSSQFKDLTAHLCDLKLLHPQEVKRLQHFVCDSSSTKFPINFTQLQQLICNCCFSKCPTSEMIDALKQLRLQLRQTKGVIAIWKDQGLSNKERKELESLFERGNAKLRDFYEQIKSQKQHLESIKEQDLQLLEALDEWVIVQGIKQPFKDFTQYQSHYSELIEQIFNQARVREVHFRQKKNTAKVTGVESLTALDSRDDAPVTVRLIAKRMTDFSVMNRQLLSFNAQKELMLSEHYPRFLGYNCHCDPHCFYYFSQHIQGTVLSSIIGKGQTLLHQDMPIFQYWCFLLYKSLFDAFLMSSHCLQLPLSLSHFVTANSGLKIIVANPIFTANRQQEEPELYEAQLLESLGTLILALIGLATDNWQEQNKVKKVQNKSLLSCLLNAKKGHRDEKQGRVRTKASFFNLQTHPLFESPSLLVAETIIQNYHHLTKGQ